MKDKNEKSKAIEPPQQPEKALKPYFDEAKGRALETEAMQWAGTPYLTQTMIKGVGVDCCRLMVALYQSFDLLKDFKFPEYRSLQDGNRNRDLVLEQIKQNNFRQEKSKEVKANPECGSLVVFRIGKERKLHLGLALTSGFVHVMTNRPTRRDGFTKQWRDRIESVWTPCVEA